MSSLFGNALEIRPATAPAEARPKTAILQTPALDRSFRFFTFEFLPTWPNDTPLRKHLCFGVAFSSPVQRLV